MGAPTGWERWLLVRLRRTSGELAYYVCAGSAGLPLVALVRVAGARWWVEEAFQAGKGDLRPGRAPGPPLALLVPVGDLAMLAYAFLVMAAATEHARHPPPLGLIPLTCNEVQHLFAAVACRPAGDRGHRLRWSA